MKSVDLRDIVDVQVTNTPPTTNTADDRRQAVAAWMIEHLPWRGVTLEAAAQYLQVMEDGWHAVEVCSSLADAPDSETRLRIAEVARDLGLDPEHLWALASVLPRDCLNTPPRKTLLSARLPGADGLQAWLAGMWAEEKIEARIKTLGPRFAYDDATVAKVHAEITKVLQEAGLLDGVPSELRWS